MSNEYREKVVENRDRLKKDGVLENRVNEKGNCIERGRWKIGKAVENKDKTACRDKWRTEREKQWRRVRGAN